MVPPTPVVNTVPFYYGLYNIVHLPLILKLPVVFPVKVGFRFFFSKLQQD